MKKRYDELRELENYWTNKAIDALLKTGSRGMYRIYRARADYIRAIKTEQLPF